MKRVFVLLVLLAVVSGSAVGQSSNQEITDEQIAQTERGILGVIAVPNWNQGFNAYINSGLDGSSVTMDIIAERDIRFFVIDASRVARDAGMGRWFGGGVAFDEECRARWQDAHFAAARREFEGWMETADV